jgi:hypothetical protein
LAPADTNSSDIIGATSTNAIIRLKTKILSKTFAKKPTHRLTAAELFLKF